MVYEIVHSAYPNKPMATVPDFMKERADIVAAAFAAEWPGNIYEVKWVNNATGSTGRDGSEVDNNDGRPDAETMGFRKEFTIREHHGTTALFYGESWWGTVWGGPPSDFAVAVNKGRT